MLIEAVDGIDKLDLRLIEEFEFNARQSYQELALKLNVSDTAVSKRLKKLFDRGIITVVAIVDPSALGYEIRAGFWINTVPDKVETVVNYLSSLKNTEVVATTMGRSNVLVSALFHNHQEILDFIAEDLGNISHTIDKYEVRLFLKTFKETRACFEHEDDTITNTRRRCKLTVLDLSLMKELELDPLITVKDMACKLNIHNSSAYRRLRILFRERLIRVIAMPNWAALGYNSMTILVKVQPGKTHSVAQELGCYHNVKQVHAILGSYGLLVWGVFRNSHETSDFLANELGRIIGITGYETLLGLNFQKYSWVVPATSLQKP